MRINGRRVQILPFIADPHRLLFTESWWTNHSITLESNLRRTNKSVVLVAKTAEIHSRRQLTKRSVTRFLRNKWKQRTEILMLTSEKSFSRMKTKSQTKRSHRKQPRQESNHWKNRFFCNFKLFNGTNGNKQFKS